VLLLAGALCTAAFFEDLMAEPQLSAQPIRLVAATLPGFGDTAPPDDLAMESYAKLAGKLAADVGCDALLGHSVGANVAIEMAAGGEFSGPLVLLSPSFSRNDESKFPRALDRIDRVLGHLPYAAMFKVIGPAMKGSLPADHHAALVVELKKNDPRFVHSHTRRYLEYLDRQGVPSHHPGHDPRRRALHDDQRTGPDRTADPRDGVRERPTLTSVGRDRRPDRQRRTPPRSGR